MPKPLFLQAMESCQGVKLTPADRLVFAYLAVRQGENRETWPALRTISRELGICNSTVLQCISRLGAAGLIEVTPGRPGRGRSHHYRVHLHKRSTDPTFCGEEKGTGIRPFPKEKGTGIRPFPADKRSDSATKKVVCAEQNISGIYQVSTIARCNHKPKPSDDITYDWDRYTFIGIAEDYIQQCTEAYPGVDIHAQIKRAAIWCRNNPRKARQRKDWPRFLGNWFSKAQRDAEASGLAQNALADDDLPTEEELVMKARAGGSKLPWLTEDPAC